MLLLLFRLALNPFISCLLFDLNKKIIFLMTYFLDDISFNDGLTEGVDYYMSKQGYRIMTEKYLRERGWCCGNGCLNCPYQPKATKGNTNLRVK